MGWVVKLSVAVALVVAALLAAFAAAEVRRERAVLERTQAGELVAVAHQVRAIATALAPMLGLERAAALASEGLEATFSGRWSWIRAADPAAPPPGSVLARLRPEERERLAKGEIVAVERGHGERPLRLLTPITGGTDGSPPLVLDLAAGGEDPASAGAIAELAFPAALTVLASAGITALLATLLVGRPLARARDALRGAAAGAPGPRLAGGADPTGLAEAASALLDRLAEARSLVEQRTIEFERAAHHLRRAERLASIGKLAAGIAHELGTPLNVVAARAKALERAAHTPAEVTRLAAIVAEQAERMTAIVRQLLDFSRRRAPHLALVDLADVARATVDLLAPQANAADVKISLEPAGPLPRTLADAAQLEQALVNIVLNAIQASPGGGDVAVRLERVRARPPALPAAPGDPPAPAIAGEADAIRISVTDHGVGIPREHLPQLFDPFFTTKPPGQGTGLGLPVAWGIVREHGGWIEVESVEGEGSRFAVFLPVRSAPS
jgi:signal transduction histidine kinase